MPRMAVSPLGQNVRKTMTERTRERGKWSLTKDTPKESTTIGTKLPKNNRSRYYVRQFFLGQLKWFYFDSFSD